MIDRISEAVINKKHVFMKSENYKIRFRFMINPI